LPLTGFELVSNYRGKRFVFSTKTVFDSRVNKYVTEYRDKSNLGDNNLWHHYTSTEYIAPNIIQNYITNNAFKGTTGW
jgi:hypothetical protein